MPFNRWKLVAERSTEVDRVAMFITRMYLKLTRSRYDA